MVGPQVDFQWAAPSQPKSMGIPSLDMQRAESSRQHVRALNNQFARFVMLTVSFKACGFVICSVVD